MIIVKKILLIVDMQNGFARYEQTINLGEKIRLLLDTKCFDVVVATRFLNAEHSIYEKLFSWKRLQTTEDQELVYGYEKYVDYIVDKYVYNCVTPSFIQRLCQLNDGNYPEKIYIVGADTDCCVLTISTALFENNIRPVVLTQYVDSNGGPKSHEAGILCMKRLIGKEQLVDKVVNSKEDIENM